MPCAALAHINQVWMISEITVVLEIFPPLKDLTDSSKSPRIWAHPSLTQATPRVFFFTHRTRDNTISMGTVKTQGVYSNTTVY